MARKKKSLAELKDEQKRIASDIREARKRVASELGAVVFEVVGEVDPKILKAVLKNVHSEVWEGKRSVDSGRSVTPASVRSSAPTRVPPQSVQARPQSTPVDSNQTVIDAELSRGQMGA